jgi:hypothetical protein
MRRSAEPKPLKTLVKSAQNEPSAAISHKHFRPAERYDFDWLTRRRGTSPSNASQPNLSLV